MSKWENKKTNIYFLFLSQFQCGVYVFKAWGPQSLCFGSDSPRNIQVWLDKDGLFSQHHTGTQKEGRNDTVGSSLLQRI